ncbi:DNA-directed RNA polymerase subunit delta [Radiobacillus deserti]|uniref:Probable DNA-directed RNA polymerase subunit delta n=1 Tax=Radiobacillus deserti TaxID=2594883 RepID=A0A516KJX8_9BACI|nr:DNA-directed RNA polymerase subunit delta [Radiobacillus deserti]QDP41687.1 DNA-directed RNA polymerase subunit delta [Radiobacillus deserti]
MSLKDYSREELLDLSMIEIANLILNEENKAMDFRELFDRIAELKEFSKQQKDDYIAQYYTDLNTDGRFLTIGNNIWGLKRWYPVEQIEEEINLEPKKKKKKAAKKKVEDFDDVVEDDLDLDEEEFDLDDEEDLEETDDEDVEDYDFDDSDDDSDFEDDDSDSDDFEGDDFEDDDEDDDSELDDEEDED